ncbi:hypothetical protein [Massilia timonae]|uniref:Uncharacterized protein n=1 Tax=Massilia timonae TaxID=47229 RepID=A0A1S2NBR1_9BURK|nr:hypothetical protein [Massilia timonae]OIJ42283.1 hypothetical protein LO55_26 [Massilia timonae]
MAWRRRWRWPAAAGVGACIGLGLIVLADKGEAVPDAAQAPQSAPPIAEARPVAPRLEDRAVRRRQLVEQVRLTDHTYCSYLAHSRYPHDSRPAGHHSDQLYPNQPLLETNPMRAEGGDSHPEVQLQTAQSRVYLAAGEEARFSLRAVDGGGQPLPLVVTRALAQGMTYGPSRPAPQVAVPFAEQGGAWQGTLAPAQTALAGFHGTIRLEVRYQAGGRAGFVLFDVMYSPQSPATWSGAPREAVDGGALQFALPLEVRLPGRYVVTGRVDDADGRPFALATFNEVLGQGAQQVRLRVYGKLLHDGAPRLPLLLRDVEGYLLRENVDPDRLLLPRLEGKVFASRTRSLAGVPDAEWQSEERSRYLAEYAKDRAAARTRLAHFDPQAPLPPADCRMDRVVQ